MKSTNVSEVTLYLFKPWAEALARFAGKALEGESLSTDLKGALIDLKEALAAKGF